MRVTLTIIIALLLTANAAAQDNPLTANAGFAAPALAGCNTDLRYLNQVSGWQESWPSQWIRAVDNDAEEGAVQQWSQAPKALMQLKINLQAGIKNEETAPRAVVLRIRQQLRDLSAALSNRDQQYFTAGDSKTGAQWNALMEERITPAVVDFTKFIEDVYLPAARVEPGLFNVRNGADCFEHAAEWWTTLRLSPDELRSTGNRLMEETRQQLMMTAREGESYTDIMARLRASQKTDTTTSAELIGLSAAALNRADAQTLTMFSKKAGKAITIVEIPEHVQASYPAGGYSSAQESGGVANYFINPSRPGERRLMAEVIAFHEGTPGHHLFFSYPRDTPSAGYNAGILEGWAIYAEYVADEMGLYSSPYDRQGMITKHLWATSRLIVEPGLHLGGWSREEAINFMLENTVMSQTEIEIEVDRYIAMPGQSLSYMLGADLIMSERERAKERMGGAFDIKAFHDVVLIPGVRPLPKLRADIREWSGVQ
jgi:uncharacterized protein (DUF885 family)